MFTFGNNKIRKNSGRNKSVFTFGNNIKSELRDASGGRCTLCKNKAYHANRGVENYIVSPDNFGHRSYKNFTIDPNILISNINKIWLCKNCNEKIDNFPVQLLNEWKKNHEEIIRQTSNSDFMKIDSISDIMLK